MSCFENTAPFVCASAADGTRTTLIAHYTYGKNAAGETLVESVHYTGADDVVVDTSAMKLSAGECPVYQPDVEFERLCDIQPDGTFIEFLCRTITSFDTSGVVIDPAQVDYFELDKVTPYTPTGTVGPCPDCAPAIALGVLTAWGV